RLVLVRLLIDALAPGSGVTAACGTVVARDEPEVVVLVEVDVAGHVAARSAVVRDPEDLLLAGEVQVSRGSWYVVDKLEARQLEVADPGIPRTDVGGLRRGGSVQERPACEVVRVPGRSIRVGDIGGHRRGVVEIHPVVAGEVVVDAGAV